MKKTLFILLLSTFALSSYCNSLPAWDFSDGSFHNWKATNFKSYKIEKGKGLVGISAKAPYLYSPALKIDASQATVLEIICETTYPHITVYFSKEGKPFSESRKLRKKILTNGLQTVTIDCALNPEWNGIITGLRIDPAYGKSVPVCVKSIRFKKLDHRFVYYYDFRNGSELGWRTENFQKVSIIKGTGIEGISKKNPYLYSPVLDLPAKEYPIVEIILSTPAPHVTMYFSRKDIPFSEKTACRKKIGGEGFQRVIFDLSKHSEWKGNIKSLRIDPSTIDNSKTIIRSIHIRPKDNNVFFNGDFFIHQLDSPTMVSGWKGDYSVNPSGRGIVLKAGGKVVSDSIEVLHNNPIFCKIDGSKGSGTHFLFFDIFGKEICASNIVDSVTSLIQVPLNAASCVLELVNLGSKDLLVSKVQCRFVLEKKVGWEAEWIWIPKRASSQFFEGIFEKDFTINNLGNLDKAILQATADDLLEINLNGTVLQAPNLDSWGTPDLFNVKKNLRTGVNKLKIKVVNGGGAAGLLAELKYTDKNQNARIIRTDNTWTVNYGKYHDNAEVVAEEGQSPWGNIPFSLSSILTGDFTMSGFPEHADENSSIKADITVDLRNVPKTIKGKMLDFCIYLRNDKYNILVDECSFLAEPVIKRSFNLNLKYIPTGTYEVYPVMPMVDLCSSRKYRLDVDRKSMLQMSSISIIDHETVPKFLINEKEKVLPAHLLTTMDQTINNYRQIKNSVDSGIKGVWLQYQSWHYNSDNSFNFNNLDNMCSNILARNPDAHIVLCIYIDSVGNLHMRKWNDENPDELTAKEDGSTGIKNYSDSPEKSPSMASKKWMAEADRLLYALVKHIKNQAYAEKVVGIVPSSGITWEWMYWGSQKNEFADYSKPFQDAFRSWTENKYNKNISRLNQIWHKDYKSFSEVEIPSVKERRSDDMIDLRSPGEVQYLIDFQEYISWVVSSAICHYAATVKEASGGRLLTGAYYGYVNFLTWGSLSHNTGHFNLDKVLNCPDIDMLMSPTRYADRQAGGAGGYMIPEASVRLHKKLLVCESDIRTVHSPQSTRIKSLAGSKCVLERAVATDLVSGVATRWFTFGLGWIMGDKRLANVTGRLAKLSESLDKLGLRTYNPSQSIAVFTSEKSTYYTGFNSSITSSFVSQQYPELFRSGAGIDMYLMADLERVSTDYKFYIFLNPFFLSRSQVDFIQNKLKGNNRSLLFYYGAGIIGKDSINVYQMNKLLEMRFQINETKSQRVLKLTEKGNQYFNNPRTKQYKSSRPYGPLFYPESGGTILGVLKDGKTGLAVKEKSDYRIIFSAVPAMSGELLAAIAEKCEVNVYNSNHSDVTWASGKIFSVHTLSGGKRIYKVPVLNGTVTELLTGWESKIINGSFEYSSSALSTMIFIVN